MSTQRSSAYQKILNEITTLIREKGVTQAELGRILDLPQPSISNLLKGKTRLSIEQLIQLSERLQFSLQSLFSRVEDTLVSQKDMPKDLADAVYQSKDHFLCYLRAFAGLAFNDAVLICENSKTRARDVLKELVKKELLVQDGEIYHTNRQYVFQLLKTHQALEIYQEIIKNSWIKARDNVNNKEFGQERFHYYAFENLSRPQALALREQMYKVYETLNGFMIQNSKEPPEKLKDTRFWLTHLFLATPLED